jgi:CheY-like chemotaxis protein
MTEEKKSVKILLVEDDSFLASVYATKFELEGFTVFHASDGEMGVTMAEKNDPDIVLLDILMPKMDGFETLRRLKMDPKLVHIPVVMLTNLGQKEDVERCLKDGAVDYLIKAHFVPGEAVKKVRKILNLAQ